MVMPCSQNEIAVLYNYLQNIRKFTRIKAVTVGYRYIWLEARSWRPDAALDMKHAAARAAGPRSRRSSSASRFDGTRRA